MVLIENIFAIKITIFQFFFTQLHIIIIISITMKNTRHVFLSKYRFEINKKLEEIFFLNESLNFKLLFDIIGTNIKVFVISSN